MGNRVLEMNTCLQSKGIVWNNIYRDWGIDHDLVRNAKEGVVVPGDQKRMVDFNDILNGIDKCLLQMSVVIDVFTRKYKPYEVVIRFIIFMKAIRTVNEFTQAVGYGWVVVEEIGHRR